MIRILLLALLLALAGCAETALFEPEPSESESDLRKEDIRRTARFSRTAEESGLGVPFRVYADIPDSLSQSILDQMRVRFPNRELAAQEHNTRPRFTEADFIAKMQQKDSSVTTLDEAKAVYELHQNSIDLKSEIPMINGVGSGYWLKNFEHGFSAYYAEVLGNAFIGSRHLTTICYHHEYDVCDYYGCEYECENAGCVVEFTSGAAQAMTVVEWDADVYALGFRFPPTLVINGVETVNYTFWPDSAKYP